MIELLNGDCLNLMKNIPDKSIDLVICDPPYGIGTAYKTDLAWDKWDSDKSYIEWVGKTFLEVQRIMKDCGSFYWFHNDFMMLCDLQQWIKNNTKFKFMQFITWNKRFDGCNKKSYLDGYIAEERIKNYYKMAEYIMFYTFDNHGKIYAERVKRGIKQNDISKEIKSKNGNQTGWFSNIETGKYFPTEQTIKPIEKYLGLGMNDLVHTFNSQKKHHSVWNYTISEKQFHPTQKPIALIENIVLHSSNENDVILDYCMGSGTTGVACKKLNRNFIGIELDEDFFKIAKNRIGDYQ